MKNILFTTHLDDKFIDGAFRTIEYAFDAKKLRKINAIILQDKLRINSISTNHLMYLLKQVIRPIYKFLKVSIFK